MIFTRHTYKKKITFTCFCFPVGFCHPNLSIFASAHLCTRRAHNDSTSNKGLPEVRLQHAHIIQTGFRYQDIYLQNKLVTSYVKCGKLGDACKVFDTMIERDVVSWTTLIAAHAKQGYCQDALNVFYQMCRVGVRPDHFTFSSVLPACRDLASVEQIHEQAIVNVVDSDVFVGNALLDRYAKCGSMDKARKVFDIMPIRDVVSWNSLIAGYGQHGRVGEASELFSEMPKRDLTSWNLMIAVYTQNGYIDNARKLFQEMPRQDVVSWNAMIAGYAQIGRLDEALELFHRIPQQNVVSWNAMIGGFSKNGHAEEALRLYRQMQFKGAKPNPQTFATVLSACADLEDLDQGKEIHEAIISFEYESNVIVASALVDMYAKCGSQENACEIFNNVRHRDVVLWNSMIAAHVYCGDIDNALKCFQNIPQRDTISWNSIIGGYARNGHTGEALKLFQEMPKRNVISWNTMITGYSQNGHAEEALELFRRMQSAGIKPNSQTFAGILPACANLGYLLQGKEIHEEIIRSGYWLDVFMGSALIDMYSKCGSIESAWCVFDKMPQQNVVSWNAMIAGYAIHGCSNEALKLFKDMQESCVNPDYVTFVGILSACCHAGLVDEGWQNFNLMTQYYNITPTAEHYSCMVGLLGKVGQLDEAKNLIDRMHIKPGSTIWLCLLGACKVHGNILLGKQVAEVLMSLNPKDAAPYVMLSNIYAASGKWDCTEKVWKTMKDGGLKKEFGCSWIEVNKQMHVFFASKVEF
ncbi:hypothetical protein SUGI_0518490 [Cryptomeria japonica]|uniref:pentatricopeptide repeat-containing protein At2g13600 n=1 Tax=Cryptomeria japonica TaxID=3369 RepID=UPI00240892EA|nr:pentatricopeptide repeat-containing protein At2g13600 [Cryptomeria japonica]GLJ26657.1 hypothetical protein SUGI_0518490 [Cryptomeria japonica]